MLNGSFMASDLHATVAFTTITVRRTQQTEGILMDGI